MALVLNDRVKETTTSTGTGTINLAGAETGFETFVAGVGNSNTCYYCIAHQSANEFEVGLGTVTDATPDTLARTTIISSSNSDSAVNFSAGTKDVFCTLPASKAVFLNSSADINLADNSKILLGAGDDLQIYHDGSNSIIADAGTGGLFLRGTDTVDIQSALGHNYLKSTINAGTQIYHNNSEKFATVSGGIKVTGNIENASGDMTIDVAGDIILDADGENIKLQDGGTEIGQIDLGSQNMNIRASVSDKDMLFLVNDGGTEITALTIDASEGGTATFNGNVGIGSTPPTTIRNDIHDTEHALQVGRAAMLFSDTGLTTDLQNNSHLNNSDQRVAMTGTLGGSLYAQYNGAHTWYTAAAVAAPNVQTMTARMSLDISGNLVVDNNITAYGSPSDIKLKENIEVIDNALDKVKQLKGITYDLKSDGNRLTGLIAQDLEKVLPEAVYETSSLDDANDKHLAIRYGNTVGLLVEAIKELEARVKELEDK